MERLVQKIADVIVVGYGPVGSTAANLLGQAGLDVVVVERDPSPYPRARAISTDEDVLRCWQHAGLVEDLKADMLGDRPIDFVDADGKSFLSFAPKTRGNGHPTQMFIYQPALEQTLRAGVRRYPNVEVLLGREAGRVRQDEHGVTLDVADLNTGERTELRGRYLFACDGGSSPIRTQLHIGFEGRTYEDPWVVVDTKVLKPWPEVDRLRFHSDPRRPAVDCPTPLDHHRWEFPVFPGEDRDEVSSERSIWTMLERYGITDEHVRILRRAVYVHHVRFASRWQDRRVFLLGDAAHCMPPWIGQGMASGVRDAANLSWKIAAVLRGRAAPSLLASYETERQPHVRDLTRAAVFFGRVITERRATIAAARNLAFRALMRTPVAGTWMRDGGWLSMPVYRNGFVDRHATSDLAGRRIVQPRVSDHDGRQVLLDDITAGTWTVVLRGATRDRDRAAIRAWESIGARTFRLVEQPPRDAGELRDDDGLMVAALAEANVDAIVLRPDAFVYTAAATQESLAGPPIEIARPAAAQPTTDPPAVGERLLALATARLSDTALERVFGNPVAIGAIFKEMAAGFVPRVANGFEGVVRYELTRPHGRDLAWSIDIGPAKAAARRSRADDAPALTLRIGLADFLRVAAQEVDQNELLKARRLTLAGDGLLGARLAPMFGLPAARDIYVTPTTVDPPATTQIPDLEPTKA